MIEFLRLNELEVDPAWKKSAIMLWKQIVDHKYATVFLNPVTDEIAKSYSSCIKVKIKTWYIDFNLEKLIFISNVKSFILSYGSHTFGDARTLTAYASKCPWMPLRLILKMQKIFGVFWTLIGKNDHPIFF